MKKIALSAAILAMTMMGCSDTGLDNTIASASTSDVQNEQIKKNTEFPLVLKKVADPVTCGTGMERPTCYTEYYHGAEGLLYTFIIHSNVESRFGSSTTLMDVELRDTQRKNLFVPKADFVHMIAVATCGCRIVGNQLKCKDHRDHQHHASNVNFMQPNGLSNTQWNDIDKPKNCSADSVSVVATYAAVFNAGTPAELVLAGNTFDGPMFDNMSVGNARNLAIRVMQKYILEPYGN